MSSRKADGVMFTDIPLAYISSLVSRVRENLRTAKRDLQRFRLSNWFVWNVQETEEETQRLARRHLGFRLYYVRDVASSIGLDPATAEELAKMQPRMVRAIFENQEAELPPESVTKLLLDHPPLAAPSRALGRHIETLQQFERRGLNEIALVLEGNPAASINLLGEHVVPLLAD